MVGRACPEKRYHLAIVVLKYILKEIPDCNLTIVSECNKDLINIFLFIINYQKINKQLSSKILNCLKIYLIIKIIAMIQQKQRHLELQTLTMEKNIQY